MRNIFLHFAMLMCPFIAMACDDEPLKPRDMLHGEEAFIFWHWDTLYIDVGGHLYYCHELQHSIKCFCFDDDDVE